MQSTKKALLTAMTIVLFCGPAFAIDFTNYPSSAEAYARVGVRHWTTGTPIYDDKPSIPTRRLWADNSRRSRVREISYCYVSGAFLWH